MKNDKKSKDFFNAKDSPMITFKSTRVVQTGPSTFDLEGDFAIRGVTKTEELTLTDNGKGSTSGSIDGTMAFDRKDYGMNSNIPFIVIVAVPSSTHCVSSRFIRIRLHRGSRHRNSRHSVLELARVP